MKIQHKLAILVFSTLVSAVWAEKSPAPASAEKPAVKAEAIPDVPPEDWQSWARWADARFRVNDGQGHGPDIGSDEWAGAVGKLLNVAGDNGQALELKSEPWKQAVEKKLGWNPTGPGESRALLSSHDTIARFVGTAERKCMGLTSLCPDRCGHSGKMATFAIEKYLFHQKPGEYGDEKQEQFLVLVENNMNESKIPKEIREQILALKPGDRVRLQWAHDYVTRDGSKFPDRPITGIRLMPDFQ